MSIRFTALTVREGDAFLLEDNGWKCLFDSGVDESIIDLLKYKGIDCLDLAICSHNDSDHANGFIALFNANFPIKEIWLPGLWANVLKFVADNCKNRREVVLDNEDFDGELDSLFSEESVDDDSFERDLAFLAEMKNTEALKESCNRLHDKLADHITNNPGILENLLERNFQIHFKGEDKEVYSREQWVDYVEEALRDYYPWGAFWVRHKSRNGYPHNIKPFKLLLHRIQQRPDIAHSMIKESLDLKLGRIIDLATLARKKGCTIRLFEPTLSCTNIAIDYGFVSLNSSKMCKISMPKSGMAYMYLLSLTQENEYSLVFEYSKSDVQLIRFSADSDCTCQSVSPYPGSIIVTAPHHGSAANANVYNAIQGNDLIWVRSDKRTNKRPCMEFKNRNNKFCLACDRYNFVSEICFEYNHVLKKWDYVRGEQCRCK